MQGSLGMKMTELGPRPSDPSTISFDPSCFEVVGEKVEFVVCRLAPAYPAVFSTREEAEAFAKVRRLTVNESRKQVVRRVSWVAR